MAVEVVGRDVEEDADRSRGNARCPRAGSSRARQTIQASGSGSATVAERAADVPGHLDRPSGGAEDRAEELGRGRLPVRAGDAEHRVAGEESVRRARPRSTPGRHAARAAATSGASAGTPGLFTSRSMPSTQRGVVRAESHFDDLPREASRCPAPRRGRPRRPPRRARRARARRPARSGRGRPRGRVCGKVERASSWAACVSPHSSTSTGIFPRWRPCSRSPTCGRRPRRLRRRHGRRDRSRASAIDLLAGWATASSSPRERRASGRRARGRGRRLVRRPARAARSSQRLDAELLESSAELPTIDGLGARARLPRHAGAATTEIVTLVTPAGAAAPRSSRASRPTSSSRATRTRRSTATSDGMRWVNGGQRRHAVRARAGRALGAARARTSSYGAPSTTSRRPPSWIRATRDARRGQYADEYVLCCHSPDETAPYFEGMADGSGGELARSSGSRGRRRRRRGSRR